MESGANSCSIVVLNVGGKLFCTTLETLSRLPETKLGKMSAGGVLSRQREAFFDRNPKVMHSILDLYRTGELHLPTNTCSTLIRKELEFWEVPEELISECCWKTYQMSKACRRAIDHIDHSLRDRYLLTGPDPKQRPLYTRAWLTMEKPDYSVLAKVWGVIYVTFMTLSIVILALESVEALRGPATPRATNDTSHKGAQQQQHLFSRPLQVLHYLDIACNIFFTVETTVRLLTCPSKLVFLREFLNIIDLVLIVSMWLGLALEDVVVPSLGVASPNREPLMLTVEAVLTLRVFRVLHLVKRFRSMKVMALSMRASTQELCLLVSILFMAVLLYGNLAYVAELVAGTGVFCNVPTAIWWALITLTTVGYGDYYPKSVLGCCIGCACAITGLLLLAMPIAIIATNFSTYYLNMASYEQRRKRQIYIRKVLGREEVLVAAGSRNSASAHPSYATVSSGSIVATKIGGRTKGHFTCQTHPI